jgi:hypothetical protein
MNSKKTAIIAIAVLAIVISSLGAVSAFELFGMDLFGGPTTDFDNKFMSGTFTGDVTQNNVTEDNLTKGWTDSYEDKEHNITYNMSCVKDGDFITDVYQLQGLGAPEIRNYNGQPWKIFYSQAVPNSNVTDNKTSGNDTNNTINVYICEADINGTAYTINIMAYENKTECDGTLFCPLYEDYIGPLVESIQFKDAKKAPKMADLMGMSDEEFKFNREYLDGIFNGTIDPSQG